MTVIKVVPWVLHAHLLCYVPSLSRHLAASTLGLVLSLGLSELWVSRSLRLGSIHTSDPTPLSSQGGGRRERAWSCPREALHCPLNSCSQQTSR